MPRTSWRVIHLTLAFLLTVAADGARSDGQLFQGTPGYELAPRTALVIGVPGSGDQGLVRLTNPVNDAQQVAAELRGLGFSVIAPNENYTPDKLTRQVIKMAVYDFAIELRANGGVGLIYFSGHGLQRSGELYLASADYYVRFERDFVEELVPTTLFFDAFKFAGNRLNFLIVDSCRDSPIAQTLSNFGGSPRSSVTSEMEGVVVDHSTLSGQKAADGTDSLSPYAGAFVAALRKPDLDLAGFFINEIGGKLPSTQTPILQIPGRRDFVFNPTRKSYDTQMEIFVAAQTTGNRDLYEQLTTKYAGGYFTRVAQLALDNGNLAPVTPPPQLVTAINNVPLRAAPSSTAPIVGLGVAGEALQLADKVSFVGSNNWAAIVTAAHSQPVYAQASAVKPVPTKQDQYPMDFTSDATGKTLVSDGTRATIAGIVARATPGVVPRFEVTALVAAPAGSGQVSDQKNLIRQAATLTALKAAGLDTSQVAVSTRVANSGEVPGTVKVIVNTPAIDSPPK